MTFLKLLPNYWIEAVSSPDGVDCAFTPDNVGR